MSDPIHIVNLTPHTVSIVGDDGQVDLPPDGPPARCAEVVHDLGRRPTTAGHVQFVEVSYGPVTGLPEPSPGTVYLVSQVVVAALPERVDLAFPSDLVRDGEGRVVGCRALARPRGE